MPKPQQLNFALGGSSGQKDITVKTNFGGSSGGQSGGQIGDGTDSIPSSPFKISKTNTTSMKG